jgi:Fe-S cluster assembly protein SufD
MTETAAVESGRALPGLRERARERFEALPWPKPTDEDWRQTDVRPVAAFATVAAPKVAVDAARLDELPIADVAACRIVFVNGRYAPSLSRTASLPRGVRVEGLVEAAARGNGAGSALGSAASFEDKPFAALNTARFEDGALVTVAAGVEATTPVHVLHLAIPSERPHTVHARTLILAGARSRLDVVESFVTLGTGAYLTNSVTEVVAEPDAHVEHVKIQSESDEAWHVASVAARQGAGARFGSHNVSLGARLARNDIGSRMNGEGAECHLYGLYLADGSRHVDNHTWLDHAVPHCPSWEMYKGVLSGTARAIFNGRIIVRPDAQKTDAKQSNRNLLLSDGALVSTRPQLEIFANDVKCTHGATIGRLDDNALFYLTTRGIGRAEARDLLVRAFADDVLDKIPVASVRERLAAGLHERLARGLAEARA